MRAISARRATPAPAPGVRATLHALACVIVLGLSGAQQAGAATVSIGAVAGAAEVGPGMSCGQCRGFQRQTDPSGPSYTVPAGNWVLTSWSVRAGTGAQTARLIMGEPVAGDMTGNEFTLRVETGYETTVPETVTTFQANIPVEPGWLLGQDSGTGSTWLYLTDDTDDVVKSFNNTTTVGNQGTSGDTFTGYRVNIAATLESDYDNDGVPDDSADLDDDGDGVVDTSDLCPTGATGWTSGPVSDNDGDGCRGSDEDADDDNDTLADGADSCANGAVGQGGDADGDGCKDAEDSDDDGDGVADAADQCPAVAGPASSNGCPFSPPPPAVKCAGRDATKVGTTGPDTLVGTPGPDVFAALAGADTVKSLGGNDLVCGGEGADIVRGAGGRDTLLGQAGNDRLFGDKGADTARGGAGRDTVAGGIGNDRLFGVSGRDRVVGSSGNDFLKGGAGPDTLLGGLGRDRLSGGAGLDELDAGPGDDFDEHQ